MKSAALYTPAYEKFYNDTKSRLLSVACYFGIAPILWIVRGYKQKNRFVQYHFQHSLALSLLFLCYPLIFSFVYVLERITNLYSQIIFRDDSNLLAWLLASSLSINDGFYVACSIVWIAGVISAWRGTTPRIPLVSRIARNETAIKLSLYSWVFFLIVTILIILVAVHSSLIGVASDGPAQVYILYTVGGYISTEELWANYTPPRWAVTTAFYPMVLAGEKRWGHGSVSVEPLTEASFREAIQNGRFVFAASHGGEEPGSFAYSFEPYEGFLPSDISPDEVGSQLRYVYIAACDAGAKKTEWEQVLAPAQVQTFDRISYVDEHFLWMWSIGPRIISELD